MRELAGNETSTRDSSCQPRAFVLSNDFRLHDFSPRPTPLLHLFHLPLPTHHRALCPRYICVPWKHIGIYPVSIVDIAATKCIRFKAENFISTSEYSENHEKENIYDELNNGVSSAKQNSKNNIIYTRNVFEFCIRERIM